MHEGNMLAVQFPQCRRGEVTQQHAEVGAAENRLVHARCEPFAHFPERLQFTGRDGEQGRQFGRRALVDRHVRSAGMEDVRQVIFTPSTVYCARHVAHVSRRVGRGPASQPDPDQISRTATQAPIQPRASM